MVNTYWKILNKDNLVLCGQEAEKFIKNNNKKVELLNLLGIAYSDWKGAACVNYIGKSYILMKILLFL